MADFIQDGTRLIHCDTIRSIEDLGAGRVRVSYGAADSEVFTDAAARSLWHFALSRVRPTPPPALEKPAGAR
jgi:hypothetical protein